MQMDILSSSSSDLDQPLDAINPQHELVSNHDSISKLYSDAEVRADEEDHEDCEQNDDDDFTFMLIGDYESAIYGDRVIENGQIRPMFPLFDQKLLLDGAYDVEQVDRLPIQPPVDKIFIQSPRVFPSSEHDTGSYCAWSKESATASATPTGMAELSKKSNSTGFSKLWRLKEIVGRSNSSSRDAFVFLKSSDRETAASSSSKPAAGDGTFVKDNVAGGNARVVKQGSKGKKSPVSAHEAYLKSRGQTEEERRRSYLPYRPELMGFFTNVHGGLTKNVHPY
ncbi:hypothetical protein R6Q57_022291 [Mikania cordata]